LWEPLDPELWELTHNPWVVLQTVSRSKLKTLMADATFRGKVDEAARIKQQQAEVTTWFQQKYGQSP
jgi:starch phosphorylase